MLTRRQSFDVLVFGAGPAGIAAAVELNRLGARAAVVNLRRVAKPQFEALVPQVRARLRALGLERALARGSTCAGVRGQWAASIVDRSYLFEPHGNGVVIDRNQFRRDLRRCAAAAGVPFVDVDRVLEPIRDDCGWRVEVSERDDQISQLNAAWLIDATGRAACVARALGAIRQQEDCVVAIVGLLTIEGRMPPVTMIEAKSEGWWYGVAAGRHRAFLGLVTDAAQARRYRAKHIWLDLLDRTDVMASAVGRQRQLVESPRVIAASNVCREPSCGSGWIAVGDASAAHDPLDGAGVLRALDSGIEAAAALAAAETGRPFDLAVYAQRSVTCFAAHTATSRAHLERLA
jgi:flavin-dependent dehydrogenase